MKVKLWESVIVFNNIFGLPLTDAYATIRQSVQVIRHFGVCFFCNLGTPKTFFLLFHVRHHAAT